MTFILVVDANEPLASRASDALISAGHACGWVTDGDRAISLLRWKAPNLVLLDQETGGTECKRLPQMFRRAANLPALLVILLTTGPPSTGADDALESEIVDRISKPFDPRFLVWRVNHALEAHLARPLRLERDDWPAIYAGAEGASASPAG